MSEKKVCKVPCMSSISLQSHYRGAKHRKKEKVLRPKTVYCSPAPVRTSTKYKTQRPVKRGLTKDVACLKDFMHDPKREEPLVAPSKKKARWEDDEHENDPVWKQKALEFLTFHITSDSEATLVVHIAQELTEALKAFCEKKAAVNYTNSLMPLMSISQDEFPGRKSIPKHYKPYEKSKGNPNWNKGVLSQYEECSEGASFAPVNSCSYQTGDGSSSYGLKPNDFAMMAALGDSFILQNGGPGSGITERLSEFNQSASGSNSAGGASSYETSPVREYSAGDMTSDVRGSKFPDDRVSYGGESTNWRNQQVCTKARSRSDQGLPYPSSTSCFSSGRYSTNYPSQSYSSCKNDESVNSCTSANAAVSGRSDVRWNEDLRCQGFRHQKSGYKSDWSSHQYSFSGSSLHRDYQQFRSSDKVFDEDAVGLTPTILNRLQGRDIPPMTRMHKQLNPYYPALQIKIVISSHVK